MPLERETSVGKRQEWERGKRVCQGDMPEPTRLLVRSHCDESPVCEPHRLTAVRKNTIQLRENPLV